MTDSQRRQITKSGRRRAGGFPSGWRHPKAVPWHVLRERLSLLQLHGVTLYLSTLRRSGRYRLVRGRCHLCGKVKTFYVDNLLSGKSHGCRCVPKRKYGGDLRAEGLGQRYDAMVQRCYRDTHVSSHRYKGRGIKVLFRSREHFIRWALDTYPDSTFEGLDFDRTDNNGHYEPKNLRLVSRRENLRNR